MDYTSKSMSYFEGARKPFVDFLPKNQSARLLEVGCGAGGTAAYAFEQGKCGYTVGVELCEIPAMEAKQKLNQVLVGNVEAMELPFPDGSFDVLILSEVLEHLTDPWIALRRLRRLMRPQSVVIAGSPNVCHYRVLFTQLKGEWKYESRGVFDATHLRWFSPSSYKRLFEDCGFVVDGVGPARPLGKKSRILDLLTGRRITHLLYTQIVLKAHCE